MTAKQPPKKVPAKKAGAVSAETFEQKRERKRAEARERAVKRETERRLALEKSLGPGGKIRGRPIINSSWWELSDQDRSRFDRVHGVTDAINQIREKFHESDYDLIFNAIGASISFHKFSELVDQLECSELEYVDFDDFTNELTHVRIGFELALQALDKVLIDRGIVLDRRSEGGKNKSVPAWHSECIRLARVYLDAGTESHDLVGKLSQRINRDRTTIARVLRKAGIK